MLDIRFVRENQEAVAEAMKNRNHSWNPERFAELDERRRGAIADEEQLLAQRNAISKSIGRLMSEGKQAEADEAKAHVSELKEKIAQLSTLRTEAEEALQEILLATPNIPSNTTPVGADENDNPEVRRWGTPPTFDFDFKAHWDLGVDLGIIDFERAVKLAESRFVLLGGLGARLERALICFMADTHVSRGYKEWWCPAMANAQTLTGTGQLPKFEEDLFKTTEGLYLIPTAEVQLTNIHSGEVLEAKDLPLKYCAYTPALEKKQVQLVVIHVVLSACINLIRLRWLNMPSLKSLMMILRPWLRMRKIFCNFSVCPIVLLAFVQETLVFLLLRPMIWKYGFLLMVLTKRFLPAQIVRTSKPVALTLNIVILTISKAHVMCTLLTDRDWLLDVLWLLLWKITSKQTVQLKCLMS